MIFSGVEWTISFRYLRARKDGFISLISWFSFIGIALGVATLIIVLSVMGGFRNELIGRILGINGHIEVRSANGLIPDYDSLRQTIQDVEGVVSTTSIVNGRAMIIGRHMADGAVIRGMPIESLRQRKLLSENITQGSLEKMSSESIIIGDKLARRLGVRVGDSVRLMSMKMLKVMFGSVPRQKAYKVAAVFDLGVNEYNSHFIFMDLKEAQRYFSLGAENVNSIEVFVSDHDKMHLIKRDLQSIIGQDFAIIDWKEWNSSLINILNIERNVMFIILMVIIVVAAFNIISTLIMLVKDKGKDIAILRTMGANKGTVMRIFLIYGCFIGFIGCLFGCALGVIFVLNIDHIQDFIEYIMGVEVSDAQIYVLSNLPATLNIKEVAVVMFLAFFLSVLATLYPSWRASRVEPVEALRYE